MIIDVYADVVFLINFGVNAVVLGLAGVLMRRRARWWRVLLGGAASGLFYTLLLFSPLRGWLNVFASFVVLAPGAWVAFGHKDWWKFGVNLGVAYICAFALGGLALVVMYIAPSQDWAWSTVSMAARHATPLHLIIAIIISFVIIKFTKRHMAAKILDKQTFVRVGVRVGEAQVNMIALVDTGMTLVEPISQKPVIIAEIDVLSPLLPSPIIQMYKNKQQHDLETVLQSFTDAGLQHRIRMIPFKSIGAENGVLTGFKPDSTKVDGVEIDAIIGICDFELGNGEYEALIGGGTK